MRIGTQKVSEIGRPKGKPYDDAIDAELAGGTPAGLAEDLQKLIGHEQVLTRAMDLVRYASDASPYRYIPQVVVVPRDADEVKAVMAYAVENGRHLTFRAGGTSLCGQAQSDDILVDARKHFYGMAVEDGGTRLRVRPGTVLDHANIVLSRYQRRLGPDPASGKAATIGGIISNNSGGMRCRLERNSYHTVKELTFVLPSGTIINTGADDAEAAFTAAEPELAKGLMEIRKDILDDKELTAKITAKFGIRETCGYALNAFLDADTPLEIFRRLLIGGEGTLAFVSEVVFETITDPVIQTVSVIPVHSIPDATALVPEIEKRGAEAVELMLGSALKASRQVWQDTPSYWDDLPDDSAALIVEFRRDTEDEIAADHAAVAEIVKKHGTKMIQPLTFTQDPAEIEAIWTVRDGLAGIVGKMRPPGTAFITEDVCFPPDRVGEAAADLMALLGKHGFSPAVAGHAAYGNLHFTLVTKLGSAEAIQHYEDFMEGFVHLVIDKYHGSLKAEHGTGINMAPFVRREWGDKATDIMWKLKNLADPHGVLGKNIKLSKDDHINLKKFKSTPDIEEVATQCIECGFCEPVCPSRNATVTPRQRILLRREMARQPKESPVLTELLADYQHDGIETCAVDGTCEDRCPIGINTGEMIKGFRRAESTDAREAVALTIAKNYATAESLARDAVGAADIVQHMVGDGALRAITDSVRVAFSHDLIPTVPGPMPHPGAATMPKTSKEGAVAVYFPACVNRIFGRSPNESLSSASLPETIVTLSERAGSPVWIPDNVAGNCCATPWSSKGYVDGNTWMAEHTIDSMWEWSDEGKLPVIIDAASCTLGISKEVRDFIDKEHTKRLDAMTLMDSVEWCEKLLDGLTITRPVDRVALHPTCSTTHLGLNDALEKLAGQLANSVYIPVGTTCCGTAGDRVMLHPELVESATREERAGLDVTPVNAYLSDNRTCEMGLLQITGKPYESFVYLLEEVSRP